jgi:predicted ArsR family transcriptional regulator
MTARQHLTGLERDGLVQSEKVRRSNGRPHYLYTMTPRGEDMFPRRYDLLARIILDEVGSLTPDQLEGLSAADKRSLLIQRSADRLAERYRFRVEGRSLEERVAAVTDVLHLIGGFAEWLSLDHGFEIRDYNCVFAHLIDDPGGCCEGHERLITQLLKWPARFETSAGGRVHCCRYVISSQAYNQEGLLANA